MLQASAQENIIVIISATGILVLLGGFVISFLFFYQRKQHKNRVEKEQMKSQFEQAILQTQLEIQEQTLKNISQEIHDNIGQALSLAKLNMNTMLPVTDEKLEEKIITSKQLISKAIGDLRDLSRSLDTDYVKEMGLQRAIEYELEMMQKTGAIGTQLEVEGTIVRLDKQKELILFRIIQETFHNVIKHAAARNLKTGVYYRADELELVVMDDGKGMDLALLNGAGNSDPGLGIRNMHSRARLIGASFKMNSTPGKGTEVRIVLPLEYNANENK